MGYAFPALVILFDLVIPFALILWTLTTRAQSRLYLASIVVLTALALLVIARSMLGFWHVVGVFWPWVFLALFAAVIILRLRRGVPSRWRPKGWRETVVTGVNLVFAGLCALPLPLLAQAGAYEGPALRLSPPLKGGTYMVMGGGANNAVNQHSRSSRYAMDIIQLKPLGFRAAGLFPKDLARYEIYGAAIAAPCAGEVISAENGRPEQVPLHPDGADLRGGNHVVIYCQGHSVHLAHMQPGSVTVAVGQHVTDGQVLGRVGNSGNSMEPHLHLAAVQGRHLISRAEAATRGVRSVPVLIDGRFLIKGDVLSR